MSPARRHASRRRAFADSGRFDVTGVALVVVPETRGGPDEHAVLRAGPTLTVGLTGIPGRNTLRLQHGRAIERRLRAGLILPHAVGIDVVDADPVARGARSDEHRHRRLLR